jgi:hypothetical protein
MLEVALVEGKADHVKRTLLILTFGKVTSFGENMTCKFATLKLRDGLNITAFNLLSKSKNMNKKKTDLYFKITIDFHLIDALLVKENKPSNSKLL